MDNYYAQYPQKPYWVQKLNEDLSKLKPKRMPMTDIQVYDLFKKNFGVKKATKLKVSQIFLLLINLLINNFLTILIKEYTSWSKGKFPTRIPKRVSEFCPENPIEQFDKTRRVRVESHTLRVNIQSVFHHNQLDNARRRQQLEAANQIRHDRTDGSALRIQMWLIGRLVMSIVQLWQHQLL